MDLSFFTTQQNTDSSASNGGKKLNASGFNDLGLLFQNLIQGQFHKTTDPMMSPSEMIATSMDISTGAKLSPKDKNAILSDLNLEITRITESLQLALSKDSTLAKNDNIIDLQSTLVDLQQKITLDINSLQAQKTSLPDEVKIALISFLSGTPALTNNNVKQSASSPFENTEATLNETMLFEKILQNLNQGQAIDIPLDTIIATGVTPQQLASITQQDNITLSKPSQVEELSADLVALLGLTQNLPIQNILPKTGLYATLSDGGAWMLDEGIAGKPDTPIFTLEQLKAAMAGQEVTSGQGGSKAAQMMAQTANENSTNISAPSFDSLLGDDMKWFDPVSQEWVTTAALPSAMNGNNLTSLLTQTQSAHTPHPASQMVAVSLQKQAGNNENRNWTLQLDPPDLGKVEVRMNFTKDKLVKAQMIIEKPETWLMLQRDAQVLERALQNAGLESGESGLSFELADQGHEFSQNGSHDHQGSQGHTGDPSDGDIEVIETTMTWFVDPDTGTQRYNLMV